MNPEVSIGMPVYNGGRFLRPAIDCLLAQSKTDLELIISDNASTDDTEVTCREYAQKDSRVRYYRQPENRGAGFNWNFVYQMARGRFFKWASSNDRCGETFIEKCLLALQEHPDAILAYPRTVLIDDDDKVLKNYDGDLEYLESTPSGRFLSVISRMGLNNAMCGVIRLDVLRRTPGDRGYPGGDYALMAELALYGHYRLVPDYLFLRRMDQASSAKFLTKEQLAHFLKPKSKVMQRPKWHRYGDYFRTLWRTPIGPAERLRAASGVARHMVWDRQELWAELRGASSE